MSLPDDIEVLQYFNEKVDKLASLSFTPFVTDNAISTPNLLSDAQLFLDESVPNDESIDAFVLTLLYGGLAHGRDKAKRARFKRWQAEPRRFAYLKSLFVILLMDCLEVLFWLRNCNRQTLDDLA